MAPRHHVVKGALAGRRVDGPAAEVQLVVQAGGDLHRREHPHLAGHELDGQRETVELPADLGRRRRRGHRPPRACRCRPRPDAPDRRRAPPPRRQRAGGQGARTRPSPRSAAGWWRAPAAPDSWPAAMRRSPRHGVDQVLAVVEHEQAGPAAVHSEATRAASSSDAWRTSTPGRWPRRSPPGRGRQRRPGRRARLRPGARPPTSSPTSRARRVLPTPPGPVSVTRPVLGHRQPARRRRRRPGRRTTSAPGGGCPGRRHRDRRGDVARSGGC